MRLSFSKTVNNIPPAAPFAADSPLSPVVVSPGIDYGGDLERDESYFQAAGLERQESIMQNVRDRITLYHQEKPRGSSFQIDVANMPTSATPRAVAAAAVARTAAVPAIEQNVSTNTPSVRQRRCVVKFRDTVIAAITIAVVMTCVGMFVPVQYFVLAVQEGSLLWSSLAIKAQRRLINHMVYVTVPNMSYRNSLRTIGTTVERFVRNPADDAVSAISTVMESYNHHSFKPLSDEERRGIVEHSAWFTLTRQMMTLAYVDVEYGGFGSIAHESFADFLYVGFKSGQVAGARLICTSEPPDECGGPKATYIIMALEGPGNGLLTEWRLEWYNGKRSSAKSQEFPYNPRDRPYYQVQEQIFNRSDPATGQPISPSSVAPKKAWSKLYKFAGAHSKIGLSWTTPLLGDCGDYSCFEGVIAADITLDSVNADCKWHWQALHEELSSEELPVIIGPDNSSIFIVNHVSLRDPSQQGVLVGVSANDSREAMLSHSLTSAIDSPQQIINATARALLARFGSWNASGLKAGQLMQFDLRAMMERGELVNCSSDVSDKSLDTNCQALGSTSVALDDETRWLVVVTLPLMVFSRQAVRTASDVEREVDKQGAELSKRVKELWIIEFCIALGTTILCVICGIFMGSVIAKPLQRLSKLMLRLGDLDFAHDSEEYLQLRRGTFSWVQDISQLQVAYCQLARAIEAFARFVPETVVRSIVQGDPKATRLQVSRRNVTIMFTDIRDFTTITEKLSQMDLLLLLTRYLSVMTHIVELYEGVVAEILGDGLLVFWNTPDHVADHAAKACAAALTQQSSIGLLNLEFAGLGLPELAIRIGVHTGQVFTGNIGSEMKMKFGCMGDPMNTASRLEGMCKVYGVGILCSRATHDALPAEFKFFTRKLDRVQLKGKREPVEIFEVIGREEDAVEQSQLTKSAVLVATSGFAKKTSGRECDANRQAEDPEIGNRETIEGATDDDSLDSHPRVRRDLTSSLRPTASVALEALTRSASSLREKEALLWEPVRRFVATFRSPKDTTAQPTKADSGTLSGTCSINERLEVITEGRRALVRQYEIALEAFQAGKFTQARDVLEDLLRRTPDDVATARLLTRTCQYITPDGQISLSEEELNQWDGVDVMTEK